MLFKSKVVFLILSYSLCVYAEAGSYDFYKDLIRNASEATIEYYGLYHECFASVALKRNCTKNGEILSSSYVGNIDVVRAGVLERYKELYSSDGSVKSTKGVNLNVARESFYHESIYLQRMLLIFIANVEKTCGRPDSYQPLIKWSQTLMEYYVDNPSLLNDSYFSKYDASILDYVKKNEAKCAEYLQINSRLFHEVYSYQVSGMKEHVEKEQLLSLFVYSLMKQFSERSEH